MHASSISDTTTDQMQWEQARRVSEVEVEVVSDLGGPPAQRERPQHQQGMSHGRAAHTCFQPGPWHRSSVKQMQLSLP